MSGKTTFEATSNRELYTLTIIQGIREFIYIYSAHIRNFLLNIGRQEAIIHMPTLNKQWKMRWGSNDEKEVLVS